MSQKKKKQQKILADANPHLPPNFFIEFSLNRTNTLSHNVPINTLSRVFEAALDVKTCPSHKP
jgi:hypothetical protein